MKKLSVLMFFMLLSGVVLCISDRAYGSENGSFGSYLVGTIDQREGQSTLLQIINPTANKLKIVMGLFSPTGDPIRCQRADLPPNGMYQTIINAETAETKPPTGHVGVVKIVSVDPERGEKIVEGITGFQRHYFKSGMAIWGSENSSESNLAAIPAEYLMQGDPPELKKILGSCGP